MLHGDASTVVTHEHVFSHVSTVRCHEYVARHLAQRRFSAVLTFACSTVDEPWQYYNERYCAQQKYQRAHGKFIVGRGVGLHAVLQSGIHSFGSCRHARVPIAFAERRNHVSCLYAFACRVGQNAFQTIARGETYAALVGHEEYEQSVVALLLAHTPQTEQAVREVERVVFAYRRQHHHAHLNVRLLLKTAEHGVYGVACGRRQYACRVANVQPRVGQSDVGHILHLVCTHAVLCRRRQHKRGKTCD